MLVIVICPVIAREPLVIFEHVLNASPIVRRAPVFSRPSKLVADFGLPNPSTGPTAPLESAAVENRQSTAGVSTGPVLGIENASAGTVGSGSGLGDVFEVRL